MISAFDYLKKDNICQFLLNNMCNYPMKFNGSIAHLGDCVGYLTDLEFI
jgi:hypothetical protein